MFYFLKFLTGKGSFGGKQKNNHFNLQLKNRQDDILSVDLSQNTEKILQLFSQAPDLVIRRFKMAGNSTDAALVYLKGLTDKNAIHYHVLKPLMQSSFDPNQELPITLGEIEIVYTYSQIEEAILGGDSILLLSGQNSAYQLATKGWPQREIKDPQNEISLKGAHQGFVETGSQNIALIRRYIPQKELQLKEMKVGIRGKSKVSILYLGDVASEEVLRELETRLQNINVDAIINTGELIEFIEDNPFSPFPQFILTERPDSAASQILQGRFAIILDRSPSVLIAPTNFMSFFQGIDDYGTRWLVASFIRLLRFIALMMALFLPATYVAFISFNYEVIPMKLLLSIAESRIQVPLSPMMEALLMEVTLELMREAALRLPSPIGQTIGIVGGIIIGQAAVQAGIVSNIMIIVVAVTAIASYNIPNYDMSSSIRLLRFPMMLAASFFGVIGIVVGGMTLIAHIISLESLGTPYGSPVAPFRIADMKDALLRLPLWVMKKRPHGSGADRLIRQGRKRTKR